MAASVGCPEVGNLAERVKELAQGIRELAQRVSALESRQRELEKSFATSLAQVVQNITGNLREPLQKLAEENMNIINSTRELYKLLHELQKQVDTLESRQRELKDSFAASLAQVASSVVGALRGPLQDLAERNKSIISLTQEISSSLHELQRQVKEGFGGVEQAVEGLSDGVEKLQRQIIEVADRTQRRIGEVESNLSRGLESLRGAVKGEVESLRVATLEKIDGVHVSLVEKLSELSERVLVLQSEGLGQLRRLAEEGRAIRASLEGVAVNTLAVVREELSAQSQLVEKRLGELQASFRETRAEISVDLEKFKEEMRRSLEALRADVNKRVDELAGKVLAASDDAAATLAVLEALRRDINKALDAAVASIDLCCEKKFIAVLKGEYGVR